MSDENFEPVADAVDSGTTIRVESLEATKRILLGAQIFVFPSKLVVDGVERTIEQVIRNHVIDVLVATNGNKAHAARLLGINRRSLYRLLALYALSGCDHCGGMTVKKPSHAYNCVHKK